MPEASIEFIAQVFLWFLVYSFCGWVFEFIYCSIVERHIINRGFLNGPYCPIYGVGALFDAAALSGLHNPVVIFFVGALGCTVLEYLTSYFMERIFHARWWDYSHRRFNLNGRVCLAGASLFGCGSVAIVLFAQPQLEAFTGGIERSTLMAIAGTLAVIFIADLVVTIVGLSSFRAKMDGFREQMTQQMEKFWGKAAGTGDAVKEALNDNAIASRVMTYAGKVRDRVWDTGGLWLSYLAVPLRYSRAKAAELTRHSGLGLPRFEDMYRGFKKGLNLQERRIIKAFPRMESVKPMTLGESWQALRERISRKK